MFLLYYIIGVLLVLVLPWSNQFLLVGLPRTAIFAHGVCENGCTRESYKQEYTMQFYAPIVPRYYRTIVESSSLPISVIIVGIGQADFGNMEALDADGERLMADNGRSQERDNVQVGRDNVQVGEFSWSSTRNAMGSRGLRRGTPWGFKGGVV